MTESFFFRSFSGYLYAHISYLADDCPACLLLLSTDRNAFFALAETKQKTLEVCVCVFFELNGDLHLRLCLMTVQIFFLLLKCLFETLAFDEI